MKKVLILLLASASMPLLGMYPPHEEGYTPLQNAVMAGSIKMVESYIKAGADLNVQREGNGPTALQNAVMLGNKSIVKILLNAKAKIIVGQQSALITACETISPKPEIITMLLNAIPNDQRAEVLTFRDRYGKQAIDNAAELGKQEVVEQLLFYIPSAEQKRIKDKVLALVGVSKRLPGSYTQAQKLILNQLINQLADEQMLVISRILTSKDKNGKSPFDFAIANGHAELAKMLNPNDPENMKAIRKKVENNIRATYQRQK